MANTLRIKRRLSGAAGAPSTANAGELAWNKVDGKLYVGDGVENIVLAGPGHFATLSQLSSEVSTLNAAISAEESRATAAEAALGTRIDNVLSNVDGEALDSLTEVVSAFQAADSDLNGAITSLASSASSALSSAVATLEAADSALDSRLTTAEGDIDALETRAGNIESAATTLAGRVSVNESDIDAIESAATALAGRVSTAEGDIDAIESAATSLTGRVSTLETTAAGLGTMSTQNANNVAITGGSIEGITFDGGSF
jgi:chromosome segregation ATPase